jgi:hypothetical protein
MSLLVRIPAIEQEAEPAPSEDEPLALPAAARTHCPADWRRPDGYWSCARHAGHRGRHWMRAAERPASTSGSFGTTPLPAA